MTYKIIYEMIYPVYLKGGSGVLAEECDHFKRLS